MSNDNDRVKNLSEHLIEMEIRMQKEARNKNRAAKSEIHNANIEGKAISESERD